MIGGVSGPLMTIVKINANTRCHSQKKKNQFSGVLWGGCVASQERLGKGRGGNRSSVRSVSVLMRGGPRACAEVEMEKQLA